MKRTALKKKPSTLVRKGIKRAPGGIKRPLEGANKRKKSTPTAKLKKELWELCKQIIRKRYGNECYTCSAKNLAGSNQHTAHFIARSVCGNYLKYDLRNLRVCCYRCNVSLAGNGANFYRNMVDREGQAYVDAIFQDKERLTKLDNSFLEEKVSEYRAVLDQIV